MHVAYTLDLEDLRRLWQWAHRPLWATAIGMAALLGVVAAVAFAFNHDWLLSVCLALVSLGINLPVTWAQDRRRARLAVAQAVRSDGALVGPRTLRLAPDGFHYQRPAGDEQYSWAEVQDVRRSARYFLLVLDTVGVIPIPLRAFAGRKEGELFWTALLAYKMAGSDAPPPLPADERVWPPPPRRS